MAKATQKQVRTSVGIKELKDRASAIVDRVQRTRQPITVTKNNRDVARLVPISENATDSFLERLAQVGLVARPAQGLWEDLKLEPIGMDASIAVAAIIEERGED